MCPTESAPYNKEMEERNLCDIGIGLTMNSFNLITLIEIFD
jgi:hypothetical protein